MTILASVGSPRVEMLVGVDVRNELVAVRNTVGVLVGTRVLVGRRVDVGRGVAVGPEVFRRTGPTDC